MEKSHKKISTFANYSFLVSGILVIFLIYFLISYFGNEFVFPSISSIFLEFGKFFYSYKEATYLLFSFLRVILSVIISFVISLFLTFLFVLYKPLLNFFKPILYIFKVAPLAAITMFLFISAPTYLVPFIVSSMILIPLFLEANITSISNINKDILDDLALLEANVFVKFFKVFLPMIFPYIIMSLLQGFGLCFKIVVMSEYLILQDNSLGILISTYKDSLNTAGLLACILIIVFYVVVIDLVIYLAKKLFNKKIV